MVPSRNSPTTSLLVALDHNTNCNMDVVVESAAISAAVVGIAAEVPSEMIPPEPVQATFVSPKCGQMRSH